MRYFSMLLYNIGYYCHLLNIELVVFLAPTRAVIREIRLLLKSLTKKKYLESFK